MRVQPADDSWLTPGMILLGKYRFESVLGKGGMGIVVRAYHPGLDERFAIKILRDDVADPEAAARFLREAQATARLKGEHVARVSDVGTTDAGMSYMVMELLDGADIGQMLEAQAFAPGDAVGFVLQACEALAEAHALGIVHRDIKPTNLFVIMRDERPVVKVLDFGISKVAAGIGELSLTQTQSMLGTPAYMSPEQMRSARDVDLRSDVWSLGAVLYEMIEGELPFVAETFSEMVVKVAIDDPTPPVRMPPGLAAVVLRCLAKSADDRYGSVLELAQALAPFASEPAAARDAVERIARYVGATLRPVRAITASPAPRHATPLPLEPDAPSAGRSWLVRGAVVVAVLGGAAVALALWGGGRPAPAPAPRAPVVMESPPLPPPPVVDAAVALAPVDAAPPTGSAGSAEVASSGSGSGSGSAPSGKVQQAQQPRHGGGRTIPRDPGKGSGAGSAAELYGNAHAIDSAVKAPPPPPPPPCDPFDHPNGCK